MSNEANDKIIDEVRTYVGNVWVLPNRPDLEADCIEYVYENYIDSEALKPKAEIVIEFLSKHCADAVSNEDLQHMAMQDRLRMDLEHGY
jgi:hypothetical protein|tara:strand:+ start:394 stop:660 length:267 start_codon:yes stop_codon:yes gene_type:complete